MKRKVQALVFLSVVLMMYFYPLSVVPMLFLINEWKLFGEEWRMAALLIGISIPLYGAKILLGISGWSGVIGITPVEVSRTIWWIIYLSFTALQTLAVYFVYKIGAKVGEMARVGGILMLIAVPLHLLDINLYFALTWAGLALFILGIENETGVIG